MNYPLRLFDFSNKIEILLLNIQGVPFELSHSIINCNSFKKFQIFINFYYQVLFLKFQCSLDLFKCRSICFLFSLTNSLIYITLLFIEI